MKNIMFCSALASILSGCAVMYKEPTGAEATAKLRYTQEETSSYWTQIRRYDQVACKPIDTLGYVISPGRYDGDIDKNRIGMPNSVAPRQGILERVIPANAPFATLVLTGYETSFLDLMGAGYGGLAHKASAACNLPVFTPERDKQYELSINPGIRACEVKLYVLDQGANGKTIKTDITSQQKVFQDAIQVFQGKCSR
ncbi:hypothetical protein ACFQPC_09930 [Herminiimonas glaciei]|uniref:DUF4136 domain-containing protein n=1 Tax=Herminiimonas glaciei TaxID=523788 RepID=A0ABW2IBL0_9BURK